jgi:transcriptional regulator with XRE-family HTH domain
MDPVRLGRQVRALRRRRGWRQIDLAAAGRTSRSSISRLELGQADEMTIAAVDTVARALSARLEVVLSWQGEGLDRLLDADHSRIVEIVARELRSFDWEVAIEVSFNVRGERGSIDILAFHPVARVILVVGVKSVIPDLQAMVFALDRKERLAIDIARARGWAADRSGRLLVVADGRTTRRRVAEHATLFDVAFPIRTVEVKRWLASPNASRRFSGLWFLANDRRASARQRIRVDAGAGRA